jgi:hypothetical protein
VGDLEEKAFLSIGLLTPICLEGIGFLNIPPPVAPGGIYCFKPVLDAVGILCFYCYRSS